MKRVTTIEVNGESWVVPFGFGAKYMSCAQRQLDLRATHNPARAIDDVIEVMRLVGYEPTRAAVAGWPLRKRVEAVIYCAVVYARAGDNPVPRHPELPWLPRPLAGAGHRRGSVHGTDTNGDHGMSTFTVRTRLLEAVAKWAYQDNDRPHLARVLFDGKHMVACDGHRLVVVSCETKLAPFSLDRRDCAALAAAQREFTKRRGADLVFLKVADGKAAVDIDEGRRTLLVPTQGAGDFPPWEKLLEGQKPGSPEPPAYSFQPRYLAAIDERDRRRAARRHHEGMGPG